MLAEAVQESDATDLLGAEITHSPYAYLGRLRDSSPVPDPRVRIAMTKIVGEVPSPAAPPPGCTFHPRCPRAAGPCFTDPPSLERIGNRYVACYHPENAPELSMNAA